MNIVDIKKGYIVNGSDENNQWVTSIQSVLNSNSKRYYLSQECRMENVHYLNEHGPGIFTDRETGGFLSENQWLTTTIDDRFYCFATEKIGSVVSDFYKENSYFINESTLCVPIFTKPNWKSRVFCKDSEFKEISVQEILKRAYEHELDINNLLAIITYEETKNIIMPVNYINYASMYKMDKYIQPIQGQVIAEICGRVMPGYISYASNMKGENYCEFTPEVALIDNNSTIIRQGYSTSIELKQVDCKLYTRLQDEY